jgi:hypothetical protein
MSQQPVAARDRMSIAALHSEMRVLEEIVNMMPKRREFQRDNVVSHQATAE